MTDDEASAKKREANRRLRMAVLPSAKERVVKMLEKLRDAEFVHLTDVEKQMFSVAINSVKGAR